MNSNIAGWLSVIASGASGASAAILAGPMNRQTVVVAVLAFFVGAGAAAKAFLQAPPSK